MRSKVLITSCYAKGGVVTARQLAAQYLEEAGFETSFASYAPYKLFPNLSAPLWQLLYKNPKVFFEGNHWWVGTALPEWEFMRSRNSAGWTSLIEKYEHHLVVSGPALAAYPFVQHGLKPLCWLGTSYWDERSTQYQNYAWPRKIMTLIDKRFCEAQENEILKRCSILAVSSHTAKKFQTISSSHCGVLPVPVDINFFKRSNSAGKHKDLRIGFVGRLNDSRKNIQLLFHAAKELRKTIPHLRLMLVGGDLDSALLSLAAELGLKDNIEILGRIPNEKLPEFYSQLDVFVISSFQEGLCIAGLEALSCGVPVVSTRCGGPEDYVLNGKTGYLCDFNAQDMARSIELCLEKRDLGETGRELVRHQFSNAAVKERFLKIFMASLEKPRSKLAA